MQVLITVVAKLLLLVLIMRCLVHGELGFFQDLPRAVCELTGGNYYDETVKSKAVVRLKFSKGAEADFYYHGGCYFAPKTDQSGDIFFMSLLLFYPNGLLAVVSGKFGLEVLSAFRCAFELQAEAYQQFVLEKLHFTEKAEEYQFFHLFQLNTADLFGKL